MRRGDDFDEFDSLPLVCHLLENFQALAADSLHRGSLDVEVQYRSEAHGAQTAQTVFSEAGDRISDATNDAVFQILHAAEWIDSFVGLRIPCHRIDGEVASREIRLDFLDEFDLFGAPTILVVALGAEGSHLDVERPLDHGHGAVLDAGGDDAAEQRHHLFWCRRTGDVPVLGHFAERSVTDTAADEVGLVTSLFQALMYFQNLVWDVHIDHFYHSCSIDASPILVNMALQDPPIEVEQSVPSTQHKFFPTLQAINPELWDKYTPYQLLFVEASDPSPDTGEVSYRQLPYRFTLPIPPQELTLDMPIATTIQATLTGINAQFGGAPFKDIMLQGTTGITPLKNRGVQLSQRSSLEAIFAGTVSDFGRARTAAGKLFEGGTRNLNIYSGLGKTVGDADTILETSTGYYQMRLMERFIEAYVQVKTDGMGVLSQDDQNAFIASLDPRKIRLAFCMWKDESVYLVEPLKFTKRKTASSPMEYMFSLQLRAYKRISLSRGQQDSSSHEFTARKPAKISEVFNRFRAARELIGALSDTLESMISDPANVLAESLRETSLFLSELSGVKAMVNDLPQSFDDEVFYQVGVEWRQMRINFLALISPSTDQALMQTQTGGSPLTSTQKKEIRTKIFPKLPPTQLNLSVKTRKKINEEIERVKKFTRGDFERARNNVQKAAADFADRVGAGHSTYSEVFGRGAPTVVREPTDTEMDVLYALNELAMSLDHLAVSQQIDPQVPTSLEYVAGLAEGAGIAFKVPTSKRAVPYPYGVTLERVALLYLGDANRWHEIATLNGLRSPYVDEEGFALPLLTNGDKNTVTVSDRLNLHQGQTVWLAANGVRREKRHIQRIDSVSPTQHTITLDGDADLQRFTLAGQAQLSAFLPGTVNSQQVIYIPSDAQAPEDPRTKQVPGVNDFDGLLQISGIDLLLTPSGDLAITPDGDCRIAFGLQNIVQTVKLALGTPRGSLIQHPEYGLPITVGMSTADVDAQDVLKAAKELFEKDPTFSGVRSAVVEKIGSVLKITLDVGIAGTSQFIPITVALKG